MAGFKFKLQSILSLKNQIENNIKNEMGSAVRKLEDQKNLLFEIETTRKSYIEGILNKSYSGAKVSEIREYNRYISYITEKAALQKNKVDLAEKFVDITRDKLVKAIKERKIMDKLREGKYETYLKNQVAKDQMITDEVTSYKQKTVTEGNFDQI